MCIRDRDIVESIDKIGPDATYSVPRYHFTQAAAHAFASRFYLYKGDWNNVIVHANKVFPRPTEFVGEEGAKNVAVTDQATIYLSLIHISV